MREAKGRHERATLEGGGRRQRPGRPDERPTPADLADCCRAEARSSLRKHRDIATCDGCGNLLLAYGEDETFRLTVQELESRGAEFASGRQDSLWIVSKVR